ncbi:MAG TPA: hypothetical protein VKA69_05325 [Desulfobacteria bacterium]|nr:hypothetical protein [Desulfobacteria bacterium]
MKREKRFGSFCVLFWVAVVLCLSSGTGVKAHAAEEMVPCAGQIDKEISPEAQLVSLECFFKKWEGVNTLHFKVSLKNVSDKPQRYRVNIFMDNGKAVGGLIPRKTKKGLVKPEQTVSFVYPVKDMTDKAGLVDLRITTMGQ